jgi:hypothetical protein
MALGRKRTDFDLGGNRHNVQPSEVSHLSHGLGAHVEGAAFHEPHLKNNIARDGRGKHLDVVPYHVGMQRVTSGITHAARPIDDEKFQPKYKSALPPVQIVPGQRSRTVGAGEVEPLAPGHHANRAHAQRDLRNLVHRQLGEAVIGNSVKSGSTHLPYIGKDGALKR